MKEESKKTHKKVEKWKINCSRRMIEKKVEKRKLK